MVIYVVRLVFGMPSLKSWLRLLRAVCLWADYLTCLVSVPRCYRENQLNILCAQFLCRIMCCLSGTTTATPFWGPMFIVLQRNRKISPKVSSVWCLVRDGRGRYFYECWEAGDKPVFSRSNCSQAPGQTGEPRQFPSEFLRVTCWPL